MTIVFDLDGTLCETDGTNYPSAMPIRHRIGLVNHLHSQGHCIIIDTARGSGSGIDWRPLTEAQLAEWGCHYHQLRVGQKVVGDLYVDDKALPADRLMGWVQSQC